MSGGTSGPEQLVLSPAWLATGIALLANLSISIVWPNLASSVSSTILFAVSVTLLIRANAVGASLLLPYVLLQFSVLISLNFIESGSYMPEVATTGAPSSASSSYVFYALTMDATALWVFEHVTRPTIGDQQSKSPADYPMVFFQAAMLVAGLLAIIYLSAAGLRTGFPLLTGTDRFAFRLHSAGVLTTDLLDLNIIPTAALGICAAFGRTPGIKLASYLELVSLVGLSLLYGEKFFIVIVACLLYIIPFFVREPQYASRTLLKLIPAAILSGVLLVCLTLYIYSDWGAHGLDFALTRFGDRVSGQGQIWYLAVRDFSNWLTFDSDAAQQNVRSLFAPDPADYVFTHKLGPAFFTDRYAPSKLYQSVLHNAGATTPTELFEAYGLATIGYVGLFLQMALAGVLVGRVSGWLFAAIKTMNPFYVYLPAFMTATTIKLVAQGTIYSTLSVSTFKFYSLFLALSGVVAVIERRFQIMPRSILT